MANERITGAYYEDLAELAGSEAYIVHTQTRTITEQKLAMFSGSIGETQPLHDDEEFAHSTKFGKRIMNGNWTKGMIEAISAVDLSAGTILANVETNDQIPHTPVYMGDTLNAITFVKSARLSKSNPGTGIVKVEHHAFNQNGDLVLTENRTFILYCRPQ